jgi:preprotein translocase subunit SecG
MITVLQTIHVIACILLILFVLLQAGRGAGFAVFGGGGDALFASKGGSSVLKKATMMLAGTFAVTSLFLTLIASRPGMQSVTGKSLALPQAPAQPAPSGTPAATPPVAPAAPDSK